MHLDDPRFDIDRDEVYQRAVNNSVIAMIIPAVTRDRWEFIRSMAEKYTGVFATAGLHPIFCDQHQRSDLESLEKTLQKQSLTAIGECGLDGSIEEQTREPQKFFFKAQLEMAKQYQLPVIIHARKAVEDVILTLKQHAINNPQGNGVVHSYNGSLQQAHRLLDLGYKLSFGGPVTYSGSRKLHSLVRKLPLDAIMLETDAPDQPPNHIPGEPQIKSTEPHTKKRNEPAYINKVLQAVATLRSQTAAEIADTSNCNARELFSLQLND